MAAKQMPNQMGALTPGGAAPRVATKKHKKGGGARAAALANIAKRGRIGTGAGAAPRRPEANAHLGKNLPMQNGADNDGDEMMPQARPYGR